MNAHVFDSHVRLLKCILLPTPTRYTPTASLSPIHIHAMSTAVTSASGARLLRPKRTATQKRETKARRAEMDAKLLEKQTLLNNTVMELAEEFGRYT